MGQVTTAKGVAFFDLDRTLIGVNSADLWIKREVHLGHLPRWQAMRAGWWIGLYHLGLVDLNGAIKKAISTLAGIDADGVIQRTADFWHEEIAHTVRPGAAPVIAAHREQGDAIVMLTSSSDLLSGHAARMLGFDAVLCNPLEVEDGVFTGRASEPICYGPGKVDHALQFVEGRGATLAASAFYTDSITDSPLMERVGWPVAVHPDARLARLARKRGWPIADWGETDAQGDRQT
jgi:HAD superfamily hydrolase (TIGR01490 family)